jgi:hypothetical protein
MYAVLYLVCCTEPGMLYCTRYAVQYSTPGTVRGMLYSTGYAVLYRVCCTVLGVLYAVPHMYGTIQGQEISLRPDGHVKNLTI